jgi:hypothetical protein
MHKLVVGLTAAALVTLAAPVASAHAPCDHRDHSHLHATWLGAHIDHWHYLRSDSVDAHHYRDVYVVAEHGTIVRSSLCP